VGLKRLKNEGAVFEEKRVVRLPVLLQALTMVVQALISIIEHLSTVKKQEHDGHAECHSSIASFFRLYSPLWNSGLDIIRSAVARLHAVGTL
jgi:hypothetical protein